MQYKTLLQQCEITLVNKTQTAHVNLLGGYSSEKIAGPE